MQAGVWAKHPRPASIRSADNAPQCPSFGHFRISQGACKNFQLCAILSAPSQAVRFLARCQVKKIPEQTGLFVCPTLLQFAPFLAARPRSETCSPPPYMHPSSTPHCGRSLPGKARYIAELDRLLSHAVVCNCRSPCLLSPCYP